MLASGESSKFLVKLQSMLSISQLEMEEKRLRGLPALEWIMASLITSEARDVIDKINVNTLVEGDSDGVFSDHIPAVPQAGLFENVASLIKMGELTGSSWTVSRTWRQQIRSAFDLWHRQLANSIISLVLDKTTVFAPAFINFFENHHYPHHLIGHRSPWEYTNEMINSKTKIKSNQLKGVFSCMNSRQFDKYVSTMTEYCKQGGHENAVTTSAERSVLSKSRAIYQAAGAATTLMVAETFVTFSHISS